MRQAKLTLLHAPKQCKSFEEVNDYKTTYQNCERKLAQQAENFQKRLITLANDYEEIREKYETLVTDNESYKKARENEKTEYEALITNYENDIYEKDKDIASKMAIIQNHNQSSRLCVNKNSSKDCFRIMKSKKSRGTSKNITVDTLKCEYSNCNYTNVDLIKCNLCQKYVCEECNDVVVAKLKPIMSKCDSVYFLCKDCNGLSFEELEEMIEDSVPIENDLVKSLQSMFYKKMTNMETKLEALRGRPPK